VRAKIQWQNDTRAVDLNAARNVGNSSGKTWEETWRCSVID